VQMCPFSFTLVRTITEKTKVTVQRATLKQHSPDSEISALPNVGPYIYDVSISGFTRSSIYIYDISSLRVNIIKWQVKFNPVA